MNKPVPAEKDGTPEGKTPAPPDVRSDRAAPGPPHTRTSTPLPIAEIENEEDDAKGG